MPGKKRIHENFPLTKEITATRLSKASSLESEEVMCSIEISKNQKHTYMDSSITQKNKENDNNSTCDDSSHWKKGRDSQQAKNTSQLALFF